MAQRHMDQPVDMVEIARQTTMRDIERQFPGTVKVIAPAKVNLYLAVGPRQADGYHGVTNVMHALLMHDVVLLRMRADWDTSSIVSMKHDLVEVAPGLKVGVQNIGTPGLDAEEIPAADNLACKAVAGLAQACGLHFEDEPRVMEIRIEKAIPSQAGLGGGSSDAAAALMGAAKLLSIPADDERIAAVAQGLGADVAFFLQGGCALCDGRGERIVRHLATRKDNVVIIKPEVGLSTAEVYRRFDELALAGSTDDETAVHQATEAAQIPLFNSLEAPAVDLAPAGSAGDEAAVHQATEAAQIPLFNSLEAPAADLAPEVGQVKAWALEQPGVVAAQLTGSGSATFVVCEDVNTACLVAAHAKLRGWWARTTTFGNLRVAIAPQR